MKFQNLANQIVRIFEVVGTGRQANKKAVY